MLNITEESLLLTIYLFLQKDPTEGTSDAETEVPSFDEPEQSKVLPFKLNVGQNTAMHASTTARKFLVSNVCLPGPFSCSRGYDKTGLTDTLTPWFGKGPINFSFCDFVA